MKASDVLVLPSLFEGFGLVITEAMSQGTPVITTERTAGPDLIEHGKNGWLVKAGSTESLMEAIHSVLTDRRLVSLVGREALETAKRRPWEMYSQELAAAVDAGSGHELAKPTDISKTQDRKCLKTSSPLA